MQSLEGGYFRFFFRTLFWKLANGFLTERELSQQTGLEKILQKHGEKDKTSPTVQNDKDMKDSSFTRKGDLNINANCLMYSSELGGCPCFPFSSVLRRGGSEKE